MFRILLVITLILLAMPLISKVKNYTKEKVQDVRDASGDMAKTVKTTGGVIKDVAKEIPQRIKDENDKK